MDIIKYPIKPEKEKSWHFKSHQYFTKQASNVVSSYIEHYTKEGDTIVDPFSGTGVTAIEALRLNRKVICLDINPLACFITEQNCGKIDLNHILKEFNLLEAKIKDFLNKIDGKDEKGIARLQKNMWYPKDVRLPNNADFEFVHQLFTPKQLLVFSFIFDLINNIKDKTIRNAFLFIFSASLSKANKTYMPSEKDGKQVGGGGSSIFGTYRYWKPKKLREIDVWPNFVQRFKFYYEGKKIWNNMTDKIDIEKNLTVICDSVLNLSKHIKEESIDYIYTDPPYGGHIAYLDLSTMWNAWLGFKVTKKQHNEEIIEGGDLNKTQEDYENRFAHSFNEMSKVVKKNGWMSLVFAHKKLEFWNVIIDSSEKNGLEYKGSTYQPTNNSSIHYKKNPANVLCSQRIVNFQKTFKQSKIEKSDNLAYYILNEIERSCIESRGASIDRIYQKVLDKLLDNKMIYEAKKKGYTKLDQFLDNAELFHFDSETGLYYVKDSSKADNIEKKYFANKDEIKIYLQSMLKANKAMTIDQIHKEIFELFKEEKTFPLQEKDIEELLGEVAINSKKSNKWILRSTEQVTLGFEEVLNNKLVKINTEGLTHSEVIYRLYLIGKYLGFNSWIGKREQDSASFLNNKFSDLSIKNFPIAEKDNFNKEQLDKIKQIDLIWFDKMNNPRYAFEVEESTQIITAFDRFTNLLKSDHNIGKNLFVVLPKSRQKALENKLKTSEYIGAPIYLNTKMKLLFKEDLRRFYDEHVGKDFDEVDLKAVYSDLEL